MEGGPDLRKVGMIDSLLDKLRDCSGDGVTGDGGYGDITVDKIFTGEVTG